MTLKLYTNKELPEPEYHGEKYKDYLSGSTLWGFLDSCPAEIVYGERKETQALADGSAIHSNVLEMQTFNDLYYRAYEASDKAVRTQTGIKAKLKELGIKANIKGEIWSWCCALLVSEPELEIEEVESLLIDYSNTGKSKLKPETYDNVLQMRNQLMQYPKYAELINNGQCEHSIVGEMEINGRMVKVKTRPDIIYGNTITNYKTTASAKPDKIIRDSFGFGYFAKEYFNALVFEAFTGEFPDILILAQSKKKPFVCTGVKLTDEQIEIGRLQFERAFALWCACEDAGTYIDYTQGEFIEVDTPAWMFSQVEQ